MDTSYKIHMISVPKEADDDDKYSNFKGILEGIWDDEINCKNLQGMLVYNKDQYGYSNICWQPQHLYESCNQSISVGDWYVTSDSWYVEIATEEDLEILNDEKNGYSKVIRSTDEKLGLPTFSDEFLIEYCEKNCRGFGREVPRI